MARKPKRLKLTGGRRAQRDFEGIWDYNAETYGSAMHADEYVSFLEVSTRKLEHEYDSGNPFLDATT